jgi:hypothetical protein
MDVELLGEVVVLRHQDLTALSFEVILQGRTKVLEVINGGGDKSVGFKFSILPPTWIRRRPPADRCRRLAK